MKIGFALLGLVVGVMLLFAMLTTGWQRPPVKTAQQGYRGLGMEQVSNPRHWDAVVRANRPPPAEPPASPGSEKASALYKNVQVLGDLGVDDFNRLMVSITAWVAPDQGCAYCHAGDDLAADAVYTKVVARRMLQMTKEINSRFTNHVGATGVTCYTCHRGQPVPAKSWFFGTGEPDTKGMAARRRGQNHASADVGQTSLPADILDRFLRQAGDIRVVSQKALPGSNKHDIYDTEATYGLMMHMSSALGVNCTFCHNSRSFTAWEQSSPARVTAFHGIRMARELNMSYLEPLRSVFPANRLGPQGDVAKISCATCHQGVSKPLLGANMLRDYPELAIPNRR